MQDALRRADEFFGGDRWVLCDATGNVPATACASSTMDPAKLTRALSDRYIDDYIKHWREYFRSSKVLDYSGLKDASTKLAAQAGPQSPILGLFWLASRNTGVDYTKISSADRIQKAFRSVHAVVPPDQVDRYIAEPNQPRSFVGRLEQTVANTNWFGSDDRWDLEQRRTGSLTFGFADGHTARVPIDIDQPWGANEGNMQLVQQQFADYFPLWTPNHFFVPGRMTAAVQMTPPPTHP